MTGEARSFGWPFDREQQDVQVADHRQNEGVVDAEAVGDESLVQGKNRAAHDRRVQQPRTFSGQQAPDPRCPE